MSAPLAELRVVEVGGAAPMWLGRMLRDAGASVARLAPGPLDRPELPPDVAAFAAVCGRGKRELADLDSVAGADVLVHDGGAAGALSHERLVEVAITPYGSDGPFAGRPASDLVATATSGYLNMTGAPGRPPLEPSVPFLAERHAAGHALAALLLALRRRRRAGVGARVDVSVREALMWMLVNTYQHWDIGRTSPSRRGSSYSIGDTTRAMPSLFACRDGHVVWMPMAGRLARATQRLVELMAAEGMAPRWLREMDWQAFELQTNEEVERFLEPFRAYFRAHTRAELLDVALEHGCMLAPVSRLEDALSDPQLEAQGAWATARVGDRDVRLPRAPVRFSTIEWDAAHAHGETATE
jgi:benzylsuccinate CoA-transferase BbsE subunit